LYPLNSFEATDFSHYICYTLFYYKYLSILVIPLIDTAVVVQTEVDEIPLHHLL